MTPSLEQQRAKRQVLEYLNRWSVTWLLDVVVEHFESLARAANANQVNLRAPLFESRRQVFNGLSSILKETIAPEHDRA